MKLSVEIVPYKDGQYASAYTLRISGSDESLIEQFFSTDYYAKDEGFSTIKQNVHYYTDFVGFKQSLFKHESFNGYPVYAFSNKGRLRLYGILLSERVMIVGGACIKVSRKTNGTVECLNAVAILDELYRVAFATKATYVDSKNRIQGQIAYTINV